MPTNCDTQVLLSRYPERMRPLSPPEPLGNAGGLSGAKIWRFHSAHGPLMIRAWPPDGPGPEAVQQIHGWIAEAGRLGWVPLPVPLPTRLGQTVHRLAGRTWELSPWMPGTADPARPPSHLKLRTAFEALSCFHQVLAREARLGTSPGLRARLEELLGLLQGEFDDLRGAVERASIGPMVEPARQWLELARRVGPGLVGELRRASGQVIRLQPCLRDARPDHFLWIGDRLSGLVDFGAMGLECVSADIARLLSEWLGPEPLLRAEALAAYSANRLLEGEEARLIEVFERSAALLGGARWVRWHFVERRTFDDPEAEIVGLRRALNRLVCLIELSHLGLRSS
ncbi:hypothetical protein BH23PLA1_BH23PLA1_00640 [soil metagenome]